MDNQTLANNTEDMNKAMIFYRKHVERVLAYQKANPEKVNEKNKKQYRKMKDEHPERYARFLEYHRLYNKKARDAKKAAQSTATDVIVADIL